MLHSFFFFFFCYSRSLLPESLNWRESMIFNSLLQSSQKSHPRLELKSVYPRGCDMPAGAVEWVGEMRALRWGGVAPARVPLLHARAHPPE